MEPDFEEKVYESYFNAELATKAKFYPIGQVEEGILGFDSSFYVSKSRIFYWQKHFSRNWLQGVTKDDLSWIGNQFNKMYGGVKANLFLQFKRPEYLCNSNAKEWKQWHQSYFRFKINQKQQIILEELAYAAAKKAEVLYASPTLKSRNKLIIAANDKKNLDNSRFVPALDLSEHKTCTYSAHSKSIIAHSDPLEVTPLDLEEYLKEINWYDPKKFTQTVKGIGAIINEALVNDKNNKEILELAKAVEIYTLSELSTPPDFIQDSWLDHLITIRAFSRAFGINISLLG